jgi:ribosomal protein S4
MKTNKLQYTIVYRSKDNIWGKYNHKLKFKNQKWKKLLFKLDRKRTFFFTRRPRSSKVLSRLRLMTKQKFKSFYGHLPYATLKREYKAVKKITSYHLVDNLLISLERRLDVFLFRSGLFTSIFEAQQLIKHHQIKVNNQIVSNSNFKMSSGDFIQIPPANLKKSGQMLPYLQINYSLSLLIFLRNPQVKEIKYPFSLNLKFLIGYLNKK